MADSRQSNIERFIQSNKHMQKAKSVKDLAAKAKSKGDNVHLITEELSVVVACLKKQITNTSTNRSSIEDNMQLITEAESFSSELQAAMKDLESAQSTLDMAAELFSNQLKVRGIQQEKSWLDRNTKKAKGTIMHPVLMHTAVHSYQVRKQELIQATDHCVKSVAVCEEAIQKNIAVTAQLRSRLTNEYAKEANDILSEKEIERIRKDDEFLFSMAFNRCSSVYLRPTRSNAISMENEDESNVIDNKDESNDNSDEGYRSRRIQ